jgi:hypothetical protein
MCTREHHTRSAFEDATAPLVMASVTPPASAGSFLPTDKKPRGGSPSESARPLSGYAQETALHGTHSFHWIGRAVSLVGRNKLVELTNGWWFKHLGAPSRPTARFRIESCKGTIGTNSSPLVARHDSVMYLSRRTCSSNATTVTGCDPEGYSISKPCAFKASDSR